MVQPINGQIQQVNVGEGVTGNVSLPVDITQPTEDGLAATAEYKDQRPMPFAHQTDQTQQPAPPAP